MVKKKSKRGANAKNPRLKKLLLIFAIFIILLGFAFAYEAIRKKDTVLTTCIAFAIEDPSYCTRKDCNESSNLGPCTDYKCLNDLYFLKAVRYSQQGDDSLCDRIVDEWENGYDKITCKAIVKNNISICDQHWSPVERAACISIIGRDASPCEVFNGPKDKEGIMDYLDCIDKFYTDMAYLIDDESYCEEIKKISKIPEVNTKEINEGINYTHSYYTCMGAVTRKVSWCGGGHLCFGDNNSLVKCYEEKYYIDAEKKREEKRINNLREWLRTNKTFREEYARNNNKWWWFLLD